MPETTAGLPMVTIWETHSFKEEACLLVLSSVHVLSILHVFHPTAGHSIKPSRNEKRGEVVRGAWGVWCVIRLSQAPPQWAKPRHGRPADDGVQQVAQRFRR